VFNGVASAPGIEQAVTAGIRAVAADLFRELERVNEVSPRSAAPPRWPCASTSAQTETHPEMRLRTAASSASTSSTSRSCSTGRRLDDLCAGCTCTSARDHHVEPYARAVEKALTWSSRSKPRAAGSWSFDIGGFPVPASTSPTPATPPTTCATTTLHDYASDCC
jgi:hypothetical protein